MEEYKNLKEIIELSEEEINNNDENVSAVLDLVDLKELQNLIAKNKELEEENKRLKYSLTKASEIIDEYADEVENDTKKIIEYRENI